VREAVADAEAAIEAFRPEVIEDIDAMIVKLEQLSKQERPDADVVYRCSAGIIDHAGLFGLGDVGRAAYSLCELVDRLRERGTWDTAAVAVHVGSMRLLRDMPDGEPAARTHLLSGLQAVVAKTARPEPARTQT
jgi:hypothetical protein